MYHYLLLFIIRSIYKFIFQFFFICNNSKISNNPDKYGYQVHSHNKWTRNDGVTFDDMIKLYNDIGNYNRSYKGNFTYFNRLQNIGYTYDDMNHHRINTADIIRRETLLFEKYKRRLASL